MKRDVRPPRRIYSESERVKIVHKFDSLRSAGALTAEASAEVGVPLATIFRWKSHAFGACLRAKEKAFGALLTSSFDTLYCSSATDGWDFLEALFVLVGWLRCSTKPELIDLSVATLLCAVGKQKFGAKSLSDLPSDLQKTICKYVRLSDFLNFCCTNTEEETLPEFPTFFSERLDDQPYDDRNEIAQICWCLLALGSSSATGSASLNKAMYIMQRKVFRYNWSVSRRTRDRFWRTHAPAAPFLYVEQFHSSLDLSLNPQDPDFMEQVDHLLSDPNEIRSFLQKTRATIQQLMSIMDARALEAISFPQFPDSIAPLGLPRPALTSSIVKALKGYKSAER